MIRSAWLRCSESWNALRGLISKKVSASCMLVLKECKKDRYFLERGFCRSSCDRLRKCGGRFGCGGVGGMLVPCVTFVDPKLGKKKGWSIWIEMKRLLWRNVVVGA